ncbi:MAG: DUF3794 domain-containing protein [Cellulosilyticaceae bacterium]
MKILKAVKQKYAVVGSIIDYSLQVTNNNTTKLNDIILSDTLAGELEFVLNSIRVGMEAFPNANIITGVNIGSLEVGESKLVAFKAKVLSNFITPVRNIAEGRYTYITEEYKMELGIDKSNEAQISLFNPLINIKKKANKDFVMTGDQLDYTVTLTNNGDLNTQNVIFRDNLPDEVMLVQGTFKINGQQINQVEIEKGINVGNIARAATTTVEYTVKLVDTECKGWMNNQAYVKFNYIFPNNEIGEAESQKGEVGSFAVTRIEQLVVEKLPYETEASVGDIIEYTLQAINLGQNTLEDVILLDRLHEQLQFLQGSIKVDEQPMPEGNIITGIHIGEINVDQVKTVTFKVKVLSGNAKTIFNTAEGMYKYKVKDEKEQKTCTESMPAKVNVSYPHLEVKKIANKDFAVLNEEITYTVNIQNDGDLNAYNVILKDELPKEVVLIPGSFSVNGCVVQEIEIEKGINIGTIFIEESAEITYKVCVRGTNCQGYIKNKAFVIFNYNLPNGKMGEMSTTQEDTGNCAMVMLAISNFKQFSIESYLTIVDKKPCIETINTLTGSIDILNFHLIETPKITSEEGQKLTGYKLIIRGALQLVIEYTALEEQQSVHSAQYAVPFSTFIVLPACYEVGSRLEIEGVVEDIFYKGLDIRNFFANTSVLINAKILGC